MDGLSKPSQRQKCYPRLSLAVWLLAVSEYCLLSQDMLTQSKFLLHLKMLNAGVQLAVDCVVVVLVLDCKFFCTGVCLIVVVVVVFFLVFASTQSL